MDQRFGRRALLGQQAGQLEMGFKQVRFKAERFAKVIKGGAAVADTERSAEIVFAVLLDGLADVTLAGRDRKEIVSSVWRFVAGGLRLDNKELS